MDHLVRQNEPLVHWLLQRSSYAPLSYEQALQAGRIGLWRALLRFDPGRGCTFSTYAVVAIRRRIQREAQGCQRAQRWYPELPGAPPDDLEEEVQRRLLRQAVPPWLAQLPSRLRYVIGAYYGLGGAPPQTQRAIAQSLGLTRQRVQQLLLEARLLLALPVYSWPLRLLLERTSSADVQAALRAYYRFRQQRNRRKP
jgi:RNA polymerase sigma factor (sigma-70 family)